MPEAKDTFESEEGAEGQVDLSGQKAKVAVSWDSEDITRYKLFGGDGSMSVTDKEYAAKCLPTTTKKGKEKPPKMTPRVLVARKLRFPKVRHTPSGEVYETHVDAFELALSGIFEE